MSRHIQPQHIDKILENAEKANERANEQGKLELRDRANQRLTLCILTPVLLVLVTLGLWFIPADRVVAFSDFVKVAFGAIIGAIGGYGYAKSQSAS